MDPMYSPDFSSDLLIKKIQIDRDSINWTARHIDKELVRDFAKINGRTINHLAAIEKHIQQNPNRKNQMLENLTHLQNLIEGLRTDEAFVKKVMTLPEMRDQGWVMNNLNLLHQEVDAQISTLQAVKDVQPPQSSSEQLPSQISNYAVDLESLNKRAVQGSTTYADLSFNAERGIEELLEKVPEFIDSKPFASAKDKMLKSLRDLGKAIESYEQNFAKHVFSSHFDFPGQPLRRRIDHLSSQVKALPDRPNRPKPPSTQKSAQRQPSPPRVLSPVQTKKTEEPRPLRSALKKTNPSETPKRTFAPSHQKAQNRSRGGQLFDRKRDQTIS